MTKFKRSKNRRKFSYLCLLSTTLSASAGLVSIHAAHADSQFNLSSGSWNTATAWLPNGVPGIGAVADLFKSNSLVTYNVLTNVNAPDLTAVQVANGSTMSLNAANPNSYLQTGALLVGGTNTGQAGRASAGGGGTVLQATGSVNIDAGGMIAVDSLSSYSLSGTGGINCTGNEVLAGAFVHSGGGNAIGSGYSLLNSGTYSLSNTAGGYINCDTYVNSGTFNQNGALIEGTTLSGVAGTFNFSNGGVFNYTLGNFYGLMNNIGSVSVISSSIPFTSGIVNNGLFTVNGSTGTFSGPISGSGAMLFKGPTNVVLAGINVYNGTTGVVSGTVALAGPIGTAVNNFGGSLQGNVSISSAGILVSNADDQISNTSLLTINGGTYNLNTHDETVASLLMNAGAVQQSNASLGLGIASGVITVSTGSATISGGLRSANTFNFTVNPSAMLTVNGPIANYNSAGQAMVLSGGGTMYFSGVSLVSSIDIKAGILQVSEGGVLGNLNKSLTIENGGSISLNNQSLTAGDLLGGSNGTVALGSGTLTVTSTGSTYPGNINGTGSLIKAGTGTLTLTANDSATGSTTVTAGTLTIANSAGLASTAITTAPLATINLNGVVSGIPTITADGTVNFGANTGVGIFTRNVGAISIGAAQGVGNGQVNVIASSSHVNRTLLLAAGLSFSGTTDAWAGQLDLANNDMIVHSGYLPSITNQIKSGYNASGAAWSGSGITSSKAASDTTYLTALGTIQNDLGGGTPIYGFGGTMGLFDGYNAVATDVLIKYTYYGDSNLDGVVDGSDYTRIDNGFLNHLSGWYNGDFNYDGVVDGSDYTLIDNAFNTEGTSLSSSAQIANPTAAIAGATSGAVPEPATLSLFSLGAAGLLLRRRSTFPRSVNVGSA